MVRHLLPGRRQGRRDVHRSRDVLRERIRDVLRGRSRDVRLGLRGLRRDRPGRYVWGAWGDVRLRDHPLMSRDRRWDLRQDRRRSWDENRDQWSRDVGDQK